MNHVVDKQVKELGVDEIPRQAIVELYKLMEKAQASKEGLRLVEFEVGREVTYTDGSRAYIRSGYTVNGQLVNPAVNSILKLQFSKFSRSGVALITNS